MDKILIYIGIVVVNILFVLLYQIFFYFDDKKEEDTTGGIVKRTCFKYIFSIAKIFKRFSKKNEQDEKDKIIKIDLIKVILIIFIITKILNYLIDSYTIGNQNIIIKPLENLINITQSLDIYLGIISVLVTIYIYSISLGDDFKKYILLILLGEGKVLYLIILILLFYFFNISPVLFISLILIVFYELSTMIEETFRVMNAVSFKKNWKEKIIPKITLKNLENIYYELRKRITKAMLEKDFITFEEMISYYKALLMTDRFEVPKETDKEIKNNNKEKNTAIRFLNDIYTYLLETLDGNLFDKIDDLNIELGEYYLRNNNLVIAKEYFNFIIKKYEYFSKIGIEDKGFRTFHSSVYSLYKLEENDLDKKIIIYGSILNIFFKLIKERKYEEVQEYIIIFKNKKTLLNNYSVIILINFLIYINMEPSNKKEDLLTYLKVLCWNMDLKELYKESERLDLENKFRNIGREFLEINILGTTKETYCNSFNNIILELSNIRNRRLY